jgi:hypothetical protein
MKKPVKKPEQIYLIQRNEKGAKTKKVPGTFLDF